MKPQDIYNQIKYQAEAQEKLPFESKEKIWADIENRLDKKDNKRTIFTWKTWSIAASVALIATLGIWLFQNR